MSIKNGVWHDAKLDPPKEAGSYIVATDRGGVLIGHYYPPMEFDGHRTGGKFGGARGRIAWWMDLPKAPEIKTDRRN